MKKRLNFITFLIGIAVGLNITNSEFINNFTNGYMESRTMKRDINESSTKQSFILGLTPEISYTMPDILLNKKSGELMPARISEAKVRVSSVDNSFGAGILWKFLCSVLIITGFIMVVFNIVKIVLAVNKSVIFEWINVKRLRRIGVGFVIIFVIDTIASIVQKNVALKLIEIENYKIINSSYDGSILMFGMISLLVAEIFAVGLKLKEEQELTI